MYNYAKSVDSTVTMDNYFQVTSARRLGQTQDSQFMAETDLDKRWIWGTKCSADNVCDPSLDENSNILSEMPRGYHRNNNAFGDFYNWYAATAESGTYQMNNEHAPDSICPKGWQLPILKDNKSWDNLIVDAYALNTSGNDGSNGGLTLKQSYNYVRKTPLSLTLSGLYTMTLIEPHGIFFLSYAYNAARAGRFVISDGGSHIYTQNNHLKTYGQSIRCVMK